jgi:hypothetical protein
MLIEAWALPCTDLPMITHHVTNMIVNGSWDDDEGSSDDEESQVQESERKTGISAVVSLHPAISTPAEHIGKTYLLTVE